MNSAMLELRCLRSMVDMVRDDLLADCLPFSIAKHQPRAEMSRRLKCGRQSQRQRHVSQPIPFRCLGMAFPHRPLHTELTFLQIDVTPFKARDLATPETRFPGEQYDQRASPRPTC